MKDYMMVVGCHIMDNDWVEITMVPLTTVKKKTSLLDLDNLDKIISEVQGVKLHESRVFMKLGEWRDLKIGMGSHLTLEVCSG